MITQKDVAEKAGVSFITVSRVVNNEGNVKEETRKKVEKAIKELGYFPSFSGKALNSGKCNTIAISTPINYNNNVRSEYFLRVLSGIEEITKNLQCDVLLNSFNENDTTYDYLRPLRQRKVDGIIYVGLKEMPAKMLEELKNFNFPCVVIGDRPAEKNISWVDTDNISAGYNTTSQLIQQGHKDIVFFGLDNKIFNQNILHRENGYLNAMKELLGKEKNQCRIIRSSYDENSISKSFEEFISKNKKNNTLPTAIFSATDERIPVILRILNKYEIFVPKDISIVGFDGFLIDNPFLDIQIATNVQPLKEMGEKAAKILFEKINNPTTKATSYIFEVPFFLGNSIKSID